MSPAPVPVPAPCDPRVANHSTPPDLRAVFSGRRFRLVDGAAALPAASAPVWFAATVQQQGPVVFDLWDRGGEVVARQHGACAAEAEIARLRRWAGERGSQLSFGAPLALGRSVG